ncbi:MAG: DUF488 domain-containing protein [Actinobacteria bacterium]|nr:DUF488 domain-containing protein [Actinomycetota bacterium]
MRLLTVGHGTLPSSDLAALLERADVDLLVDVRRYPASRRHPQFNHDVMAHWLGEAGIDYCHEPDLGGRRRQPPRSRHIGLTHPSFRGYADHMETGGWRRAVEQILAASRERDVALLCAESLWWRCHRRLIADVAVLVHGVDVDHLFHDGRVESHRVTDAARVEDGTVVYDVGADRPLAE